VLILQRFVLRAGLWGSLRGRRVGRRMFAFRVGRIEVVCAVYAAAQGTISPSPRVPAPQAWLADIIARISDLPVSKLPDLLPWNWKTAKTQVKTA